MRRPFYFSKKRAVQIPDALYPHKFEFSAGERVDFWEIG